MANAIAYCALLLLTLPYLILSQETNQQVETQEVKKLRLQVEETQAFLEKYGYLSKENLEDAGKTDEKLIKKYSERLKKAVKKLQYNYYLEPTGELDPETVKLVTTPRCGVPDLFQGGKTRMRADLYRPNASSFHTVSHFTFYNNAPKWNKTHLTYAFYSDFPNPIQYFDIPTLSPIMKRAFGMWSNVTNLTFEELQNGPGVDLSNADIYIAFHRGDYGFTNRSFDGRGHVFAHSLPPMWGIMHFDADENWSSAHPKREQVDLESTAVHEIGHLLGLDHASSSKSVMYAYFNYGRVKRSLRDDDINGIRTLYPTV